MEDPYIEAGGAKGPILFVYDGFEDAKAAIGQAGRQFRSGRSANRPDEQSIEREARRIADEGARLARMCGFDAQPVAERGDSIWRRIVQSAEEHDASIVVLGAHGRTGTQPVAMGSVAAAAAEHIAARKRASTAS